MSRLIHLFAWLYPRSWRARYGAEFSALLEDVRPDGRTAVNVLTGALAMQVRSWKSWKIFAASAVFGAVVATGLLSAIPNTYISSAVVKIGRPVSGYNPIDVINSVLVNEESRAKLTGIITKYNLYLNQRSRRPLDDVIDQMKRDIRVRLLDANITAIRLEFSYTDPGVAQQVTSEITSQLLAENLRQGHTLLEILDGANLPKVPAYPNRPLLIGVGGMCFLLMWGGLSAWRSVSVRRFAAGGPPISSGEIPSGGPVALSLPSFPEHLRRNAWKILISLALLISVAVLTFKVANPSYESKAVVKILPGANADSIASLTQSVESRASLAPIIAEYNLYLSEYHPEKVFEKMKEHIRIEPLGGNSAVGIRFTYPDRHIAQKVTQALALQMVEASAASDPPVELSVLDPASLPENWFPPVEPDYSVGLLFGLLLGVIGSVTVALFRRRPNLG
ncbi:MAG TPA: hypothetical protein VGG72_26170 [Bryobacteraceae bacterium]|jgi:uncharacterized protein involved in exopolysaccharide biosynthesis